LVPNLQASEAKRERDFYRSRGQACPKDTPMNLIEADATVVKKETKVPEPDYHRLDEQVNICLESRNGSVKTLKRRYVRCSALATITNVKKYIAKKTLNSVEKYNDIDILCNDELLGKDHTLKFIYVTRWRFRDPPLELQYQTKHDY